MIEAIVFAQLIPVIGTSLRLDHFEADSGWTITEGEDGITLHRPADGERQLPEIPAFIVRGVGYCRARPVAVPAIEPAPVSRRRR